MVKWSVDGVLISKQMFRLQTRNCVEENKVNTNPSCLSPLHFTGNNDNNNNNKEEEEEKEERKKEREI